MKPIDPAVRRVLPRWLWPQEPVLGIRIFMGCIGSLVMLANGTLLFLAYWRLENPSPAPLPFSRGILTGITFSLLFGHLASGVGWIMIALSNRLWAPTSTS